MTRLCWLLTGILLACIAQAQEWERQYPWSVAYDLRDIVFLNGSEGWASGCCGCILHTQNGGGTWEVRHIGGHVTFKRLSFVNSQDGWAVTRSYQGQSSIDGVSHTTDGGFSWSVQYSALDNVTSLYDVCFTDSLHGYAVGDLSHLGPPDYSLFPVILRTEDGGNQWTVSVVDSGESLFSLDFVSATEGWIGSSRGKILHTIDRGLHWIPLPTPFTVVLSDVDFYDAQWGLAIGSSQMIFYTTDSGQSWDSLPAPEGEPRRITYTDATTALVVTSENIVRILNRGDTLESLEIGSEFHGLAIANSGVDSIWVSSSGGNIFATSDGASTWEIQHRAVHNNLKSVYFINSNTGWIGGDVGFVARTTDGGEHWVSALLPNPHGLVQGMEFVDPQHGWIWGPLGYRATTDGGATWETEVYSHYSADNCNMDFLDTLHGWRSSAQYDYEYGVSSSYIERTTDGGGTWITTASSYTTSQYFGDLAFVDANRGWMRTSHLALRTTDGGGTWNEVYNASPSYLWDFKVMDSLTCWLLGDGGTLRKTTDGGAIWTIIGYFPHAQMLSLANDSMGCVMGVDRAWITTNGGATWIEEDASSVGFSIPYDLAVNEDGSAWAVGTGATVGYRNPHPSGITQPQTFAIPETPALSVFPNPFNPTTQIRIELPRAGRVRLELYDVNGRHVQTLLDEVRAAGSHTISVDGEALPSGVYFARLTAGPATLTKKLVLLR